MSEWPSARLCEVADVRVSNVDKKSLSTEQAVLLCNYMDVYSNDYITGDLNFMKATATPSQIERFRVAPGDVMITKDSETPEDIGIPSVAVDAVPNLICGYHLALLKPDPKKIDGRYLAKQLGTRDTARYFAQRAAGSTRYGLSNGTIASTPIPLAPLPQQRRIAEILTTLDEEIEATESLVGKYQQIKAGLMHDLFTRGLWTQAELDRGDHKGLPSEALAKDGTPFEASAKQGHLRPTPQQAPQLYQDSPLGKIPKAWQSQTLGANVNFIGGSGFPEVLQGEQTGEVPFYKVSDQSLPDNEKFLRNANNYVSFELARKMGWRIAPHQGVAFAKVGAALLLNRRRILSQQSLVDNNMIVVVAQNEIDPLWLYWWLLRIDFALLVQPGALPSINQSQLSRLPIPKPSLNEQKAMSGKLESLDFQLAAETAHLAKLRQQKQGLMHDLLTGRVRVA